MTDSYLVLPSALLALWICPRCPSHSRSSVVCVWNSGIVCKYFCLFPLFSVLSGAPKQFSVLVILPLRLNVDQLIELNLPFMLLRPCI